ncbi:hypothetical protein ARMGADRAFT_1021083 [Armillaria gallica]|uniref:Uncharacterized protein n=1 Tax=Armillaria gallica TaxID=47427 RepID=A0A2H3CTN5_ARMGA|nr:hypothetical protein ARMGADRAFT_1021083 [Armillaria gallica]
MDQSASGLWDDQLSVFNDSEELLCYLLVSTDVRYKNEVMSSNTPRQPSLFIAMS